MHRSPRQRRVCGRCSPNVSGVSTRVQWYKVAFGCEPTSPPGSKGSAKSWCAASAGGRGDSRAHFVSARLILRRAPPGRGGFPSNSESPGDASCSRSSSLLPILASALSERWIGEGLIGPGLGAVPSQRRRTRRGTHPTGLCTGASLEERTPLDTHEVRPDRFGIGGLAGPSRSRRPLATHDKHLGRSEAAIRQDARGVLVDLGCARAPLYQAYRDQVSEVLCIDRPQADPSHSLLGYEVDLEEGIPCPASELIRSSRQIS